MQIAEVAKRYGISVDTIRYYERIGLVPHVTRLPNGIRDFAEYDCGWVEFIRCMRESGVQIEALVEYVACSDSRILPGSTSPMRDVSSVRYSRSILSMRSKGLS